MKTAKSNVLILTLLLLFPAVGFAQKNYTVDAANIPVHTLQQIKLGNTGPSGKEILVNDRYMTVGGQPIIPVMGELHFARVPKADWEDALLKMKANGVNIVSTYIFWIHHEEIEGKFNWTGNKDLRAFVMLCQKYHLYVYPRIGPWCHGETRNGGTPDWLLQKKDIKVRSNDPQYQKYVDLWFRQIGGQLKGLMYKDGGPIIGTQLENEYVQGKKGDEHIRWLKETAIKYGLDVPLYTVTGWGNASVPKNEVIPLFGAYPDEPWGDNIERTTNCDNFRFSAIRNDDKIGNALQQSEQNIDLSAYPYFTCEIGMGIDNTSHRRLVINAIDGAGLVRAKLGSGSNLIGYYMFTGGLNPNGVLTSMEENMSETGSYSDNAAISYDFQAAVGASGALAPSYQELKKIHYFLNEFGDVLAPMEPVFVKTGDDLELSVRAKDNEAFLFGINYCRHSIKVPVKEAQFTVKLKSETVTFPSQPVNIPDSSLFMWPVNFKLNKILLKYATAQPLCSINTKNVTNWIFIQDMAIEPEFCFDAAAIEKLASNTGDVIKKDGKYIISHIKPGYNAVITLFPKNGLPQKIIILSKSEAKEAWLLKDGKEKHFFISNANMYLNEGKLHVYGTTEQVWIKGLGNDLVKPSRDLNLKKQPDGLFTSYNYHITPQKLKFTCSKQQVLGQAKWVIVNNPEKLNIGQVLRHHFFLKEFSYGQLSNIKSAQLLLSAQNNCRIQVNGIWVNQPAPANRLNTIDLTGYVQKGNNKVLLEFPFSDGKKAFAASLIINSYNNYEMELSTDSTWKTKDSYPFPSYLTGGYPDQNVQFTTKPAGLKLDFDTYQEYEIKFANGYPDNLSNAYLKIIYNGNKAFLYDGERLIWDNFNSNTPWDIGLNRLENTTLQKPLRLKLYPLKEDARIYFDIAPDSGRQALIKSVTLVPEYQADFKLGNNISTKKTEL